MESLGGRVSLHLVYFCVTNGFMPWKLIYRNSQNNIYQRVEIKKLQYFFFQICKIEYDSDNSNLRISEFNI